MVTATRLRLLWCVTGTYPLRGAHAAANSSDTAPLNIAFLSLSFSLPLFPALLASCFLPPGPISLFPSCPYGLYVFPLVKGQWVKGLPIYRKQAPQGWPVCVQPILCPIMWTRVKTPHDTDVVVNYTEDTISSARRCGCGRLLGSPGLPGVSALWPP